MQISEEQFNKFKKIYKESFGEDEFNKKTDQQLLESAIKLLTLMKVVYKPMTKEEHEKVQARRKEFWEKNQLHF